MGHGGKRSGAGRPKGSRNKLSGETLTEIRALAQAYGPKALARVATLMSHDNASVALAAAREMLDRAYGKSLQQTALTGKDGGPIAVAETPASQRLSVILSAIAPNTDHDDP